jgi:hypothetical protein
LRLSGPAVRLAFERLGVPLEVALARAEAIAQDVANRKVLPKRKSGSALHQLAVRQITALDAISPYRRWLIGFGALISAVPAAFFGVAFILARSQNVAIRILKGLGLGTGLLCVAAFMLLVWVRLWFGRRMWIDAALSALLGATYVYLFIGVWALLSFVCVKLCTL